MALTDPRPNRKKTVGKGHPFLYGRPKGVWYPDAVGVVRSYPRTLEAFQIMQARMAATMAKMIAEGRHPNRKGVPDGFAGRAAKVHQLQAKAATEARKIMAVLKEQDLIDSDDLGDEMLLGMITLARDESQPKREKLAALKAAIEYLKPKPTSTTKVELTRPEDFLDELLAASE